MYTQAMDTMGKDEARKPVRSAEEMRLEERFEARIAAGEFIEAKDWRSSACCPKATGSRARPR